MKKLFLLAILGLLAGCATSETVCSQQLPHEIPQESDLLLIRRGFTLGYSNEFRQAIWVSYILRKDELCAEPVKRSNHFRADPALGIRAVQPRDYRQTGYDKGHLAPAADMAYSVDAMTESFYMTNITPQLPGCNRGIWKRLEIQTRLWAIREERLCVITGPIFAASNSGVQTLGRTDIPVPVAFYKVILDLTPPMKMIGFIIPNQTSKKQLKSFAVSVNEVEAATNLDFFSSLPDDQENDLESQNHFELWNIVPGN